MYIHSRMPQILILLLAMVTLQSCKDTKETCPAYPKDKTDYLPTDYVFRYVVGTDTVSLKVGQPDYSSKYVKHQDEGFCTSTATVSLKSMDNTSSIEYNIRLYPDVSNTREICLSLLHGGNFTTLCSVPVFGDNRTPYFAMTAELEEWVSPVNETYQNVHVFIRPNHGNLDTLYLSKSKGLLRYAPNPEDNAAEWYLLPE